MLRRWRELVSGAGLALVGPWKLLGGVFLASTIAGAVAYELVSVLALGTTVGLFVMAVILELLSARANSRRRAIAAAWPEVLDSMISATSSGVSMIEALIELADKAPYVLRSHFLAFIRNLDSGNSFRDALGVLKSGIADPGADRFVELLRIVHEAGGVGLHEALHNQVTVSRSELALRGEIESKQGWIIGTAKLGLAAPWVIVALLATQPDNKAIYASTSGNAVLLLGLILSVFAYRIIRLLGTIRFASRTLVL